MWQRQSSDAGQPTGNLYRLRHVGHTPEFAAAAGSDLGKMQALTGAKAMAMVALDVMGEEH